MRGFKDISPTRIQFIGYPPNKIIPNSTTDIATLQGFHCQFGHRVGHPNFPIGIMDLNQINSKLIASESFDFG
jgi:hypothetical protein